MRRPIPLVVATTFAAVTAIALAQSPPPNAGAPTDCSVKEESCKRWVVQIDAGGWKGDERWYQQHRYEPSADTRSHSISLWSEQPLSMHYADVTNTSYSSSSTQTRILRYSIAGIRYEESCVLSDSPYANVEHHSLTEREGKTELAGYSVNIERLTSGKTTVTKYRWVTQRRESLPDDSVTDTTRCKNANFPFGFVRDHNLQPPPMG